MHLLARVRGVGVVIALLIAIAFGTNPSLAQPTPPLPQSVAELIRVREDVYAFRYLNHVSLFVPTDEGVVVVDPIGGGGNPQAPIALKGAIASISDQPVLDDLQPFKRGPLHRRGRLCGTATFVSQVNAKPTIEARNDPTTPVPTVTFEQTMPIDLGGKHFELTWDALTPQDDYLIFAYPAQKVIMTVDQGRVRTLAFGQIQGASPERVVEFLDWVDRTFDFDTFSRDTVRKLTLWATVRTYAIIASTMLTSWRRCVRRRQQGSLITPRRW